MAIQEKIIEKVRNSKDYKNLLCLEMNIDPSTLRRWMKLNHKNLTTADNLKILSKVLGVPQSKLLVKDSKRRAKK